MKEAVILKRLEQVDREIHSLIDEIKLKKPKALSLSELSGRMEKDRLSDEDSTKVLREMRDRKYSV
jgi:hypothetical protein